MTVEQSQASRLAPLFDSCRADSRAALIGYLPTGYPDVRTSLDAMIALVESGCDLIEVGVPYSDPGMDCPTIARATEAALRGGVRVRDTLAAVEAISLAGGRAVVMTYWNPVLRYGIDAFARDLAIEQDQLLHIRLQFAAAIETNRRDAQPFLIDMGVAAIGEIGVVGEVDRPGDDGAGVEDGLGQHDVG